MNTTKVGDQELSYKPPKYKNGMLSGAKRKDQWRSTTATDFLHKESSPPARTLAIAGKTLIILALTEVEC
jgi:hypothetical protein